MRVEAAPTSFYVTGWNESYRRLQRVIIAELLNGQRVEYPGWSGDEIAHGWCSCDYP
jgi:hypothetical protein